MFVCNCVFGPVFNIIQSFVPFCAYKHMHEILYIAIAVRWERRATTTSTTARRQNSYAQVEVILI